ncbi:MAG: hypothetical protein FWH15_09040, partial [Betaproteobacteria bacterium]|nr:hypothetical protein [Betaproteobacteria bacterium]
MDDSIRPPSTAVEDIEVAKGSGVKAVTVGLLVSVGGGILVGALLWIIYVIVILVQETPKNEVIEALSNPWMIAAATLIGCLLSVLGGYLCARIARHSEYKFGLILSGIAVISGIFFGLEYSILWNVVWALTTWGSIMLGTQLGVSRNRTDLKGNFMSRSPWEHRPALLAPLTPEEEQEVLAKALKYKPRLIIS